MQRSGEISNGHHQFVKGLSVTPAAFHFDPPGTCSWSPVLSDNDAANCSNRALSAGVISVRKAEASAPFKLFCQQRVVSWIYAPLPAAFPVRSTCMPSEVRTTRIRFRLGSTSRQPIQVRCGMCFPRLLLVLTTSFLTVTRQDFTSPNLLHLHFYACDGHRLHLDRDRTQPRGISFSSSFRLQSSARLMRCLLLHP